MTTERHAPPGRAGSDRVPARRRRGVGPPVLDNAFRPFFLGGAGWAALALGLWIAALRGAVDLRTAFAPLVWHQHEMLFGYTAAIVAGFALTAVPNWTGRLPIGGWSLAALFGLWLVGRIAVLTSEIIGAWPAAIVDVSFLMLLSGLVLREIASGRNWRNLPIASLLVVLALANLLTHLEPTVGVDTGALGIRLGLAAVLILIGLIGGRVTPSFTRNWLVKRGEARLPAPFGPFDRAALLTVVLALIGWTVAPSSELAGSLLVLAGILHGARLVRWRGARTLAEPLVIILHAGYAWLPAGLILLGLEVLDLLPVPLAALHALTAGAIGTMTLAVMTRASLGHTGRSLHAGPLTVAIYIAVISGALLRVLAPALPAYGLVLSLGSIVWGGAFLLFVLGYGPMLTRRRVDSAP